MMIGHCKSFCDSKKTRLPVFWGLVCASMMFSPKQGMCLVQVLSLNITLTVVDDRKILQYIRKICLPLISCLFTQANANCLTVPVSYLVQKHLLPIPAEVKILSLPCAISHFLIRANAQWELHGFTLALYNTLQSQFSDTIISVLSASGTTFRSSSSFGTLPVQNKHDMSLSAATNLCFLWAVRIVLVVKVKVQINL